MAIQREKLVRNAEKFVSRGRVEAAIREYRKILADQPKDTGTLNRVGDLYARINRIDEAVRLFTQIAEQYTDEGFFVKAIAIYKKIIKLDPTRLSVYEKLAELYHKQGLVNEARTQYQVLADYYLKHDNAASAISIYQNMADLEPEDPAHRVKLAELYQQEKLTDKAMGQYQLIADIMLEHGREEKAVQVLERGLELEPDDLDFLAAAVDKLRAAGANDAVKTFLTSVSEQNPAAQGMLASLPPEEEAPAQEAELGIVEPSFSEEELVETEAVGIPESIPSSPVPQPLDGGSDYENLYGELDAGPGLEVAEAESQGTYLGPDSVMQEALAAAEAFVGTDDDDESDISDTESLEDLGGELVLGWDEDEADSLIRPPQDMIDKGPDVAGSGFQKDLEEGAEEVVAEQATENVTGSWELDLDELGLNDLDDEDASGEEAQDLSIEELPGIELDPDESLFSVEIEDLEESTQLPGIGATEETLEVSSEAADGPSIDFDLSVDEPDLAVHSEVSFDLESVQPDEDLLEKLERDSVSVEEPAAELKDAGEAPDEAPDEAADEAPVVEVAPDLSMELEEVELPEMELDFEAEFPELAEVEAPQETSEEAVDLTPAPPNPEDMLSEAEVLAKYGLRPKAFERVGELLELDPENLGGHRVLVQLHLDEGNEEQVRSVAKKLEALSKGAGLFEDWNTVEAMLAAGGFALDKGKPAPEQPRKKKGKTSDRIDRLLASLLDDAPAPKARAKPRKAKLSVDDLTEQLLEPTRKTKAKPSLSDEPAEKKKPAFDLSEITDSEPGLQEPVEADSGLPEPVAETELAVEAEPAEIVAPPAEVAPVDSQDVAEDDEDALVEVVVAGPSEQEGADDLEDHSDIEDALAGMSPLQGAQPFTPATSQEGASWLDEVEAQQEAQPAPEELFDDEEEFFDLAAELEEELTVSDAIGTQPAAEQSLEEIVEGFKKGVEDQLSPEDFDTHLDLGIAYREMGLLDEAIGEFQVAAKADHLLPTCCSMLGICFLDKGLPELAVKWYTRGLAAPAASEEDSIALLYDLGDVYLSMGDVENAEKTFVEVYGINSTYRDIVAKLAELKAK